MAKRPSFERPKSKLQSVLISDINLCLKFWHNSVPILALSCFQTCWFRKFTKNMNCTATKCCSAPKIERSQQPLSNSDLQLCLEVLDGDLQLFGLFDGSVSLFLKIDTSKLQSNFRFRQIQVDRLQFGHLMRQVRNVFFESLNDWKFLTTMV